MKKIFVMAIAAICATAASAQLRVVNSGQVQIGSCSSSTSSPTISSGGSNLSKIDTLATFHLISDNYSGSGARIAFGNRHEVSISESVLTPKGNSIPQGQLLLKGAGGFKIAAAKNGLFTNVIAYDPNSASINSSIPTLNITVPVSAPQYLTVSDSKSKMDIEPLEDLGSLLSQIVPVSYHLVGDNASQSSQNSIQRSSPSDTETENGTSSSTPVQYGFLAQDVREVYPELVFEDSEGTLSIDYKHNRFFVNMLYNTK
ncbi:MAG: tail fiber domain-containing protein [Muribaculaceae bacterium]|nr:tail fiber domain-containing protein [Muribaculaceae bacterium]